MCLLCLCTRDTNTDGRAQADTKTTKLEGHCFVCERTELTNFIILFSSMLQIASLFAVSLRCASFSLVDPQYEFNKLLVS